MSAPELRMDAYYYGFGETGVRSIDRVLSAVACAGKAFHSTDQWTENCESYHPEIVGSTCEQWIQNAADVAALQTKELLSMLKETRESLDLHYDGAPDSSTRWMGTLLCRIDELLAKAEGES